MTVKYSCIVRAISQQQEDPGSKQSFTFVTENTECLIYLQNTEYPIIDLNKNIGNVK